MGRDDARRHRGDDQSYRVASLIRERAGGTLEKGRASEEGASYDAAESVRDRRGRGSGPFGRNLRATSSKRPRWPRKRVETEKRTQGESLRARATGRRDRRGKRVGRGRDGVRSDTRHRRPNEPVKGESRKRGKKG